MRGLVLLALATLGACGGHTLISTAGDGSTMDDGATTSDGSVSEADSTSTADAGDRDAPGMLFGPDVATYVGPDACINPYDAGSTPCVLSTDCCQVMQGTGCIGGYCIPYHGQ